MAQGLECPILNNNVNFILGKSFSFIFRPKAQYLYNLVVSIPRLTSSIESHKFYGYKNLPPVTFPEAPVDEKIEEASVTHLPIIIGSLNIISLQQWRQLTSWTEQRVHNISVSIFTSPSTPRTNRNKIDLVLPLVNISIVFPFSLLVLCTTHPCHKHSFFCGARGRSSSRAIC